MKQVIVISRLFTGLVFIFSGFVKVIDPTGFAIKLEEYFIAFHMDYFTVLAMPLAITVCAIELMTGLNLFFRVHLRFTVWILLVFMSFFTVLTLVLAVSNPVSDCGCFGDAVKLTNWQTFFKNIILFLPSLLLFIKRENLSYLFNNKTDLVFSGINFITGIMIAVFCLMHEPIIDFRPYKTGNNIVELMNIPEGAPVDEYEITLVYEKDGKQQEFTQDNYPWQDSTWKWVETRQKLISKGYEPPVHDFSITNSGGSDITDEVLKDSNYVFLIIAPRIEKASSNGLKKLNDLTLKAKEYGFPVYCLTSSTNNQINQYKLQNNPAFEVCTMDETTVKTIMRSNPGLMVLQKGTVLAKWNFRDVPEANDLKKDVTGLLLFRSRQVRNILVILVLVLVVLTFYSSLRFDLF